MICPYCCETMADTPGLAGQMVKCPECDESFALSPSGDAIRAIPLPLSAPLLAAVSVAGMRNLELEQIERLNDQFVSYLLATVQQTLNGMGFNCSYERLETDEMSQCDSRGTAVRIERFAISAILSYTDEGANVTVLAQPLGGKHFYREMRQFLPEEFRTQTARVWIEEHVIEATSQVIQKATLLPHISLLPRRR